MVSSYSSLEIFFSWSNWLCLQSLLRFKKEFYTVAWDEPDAKVSYPFQNPCFLLIFWILCFSCIYYLAKWKILVKLLKVFAAVLWAFFCLFILLSKQLRWGIKTSNRNGFCIGQVMMLFKTLQILFCFENLEIPFFSTRY